MIEWLIWQMVGFAAIAVLIALVLGLTRSRLVAVLCFIDWFAILIVVGVVGIEKVNAFLGRDMRFMLGMGTILVVFLGYRRLLRELRAGAGGMVQETKAPATGMPSSEGPFSQAEVSRYARHLFLREIGGPGQQKLKAAKVLVVGAGGLGSPVLLYLAGAGVGEIGVIDDDLVELPNLQRQIIHTDARIGMPKVFSAEAAMTALNPGVEIRPYQRRLDENVAEALIADYDLVLDGTDNFDTRYLVNRVCARLGKPLISGAMTQWEGQLSLWNPAQGGPCYECVFPERPAPGMVASCAEAGVVAPLPGVIGAMMALEAVKHLTGAGEGLMGRLMIHDALYAETRMIRVKKRKGCPACGG